jgi:hypothetical protein
MLSASDFAKNCGRFQAGCMHLPSYTRLWIYGAKINSMD